jgi:hypothetical protein
MKQSIFLITVVAIVTMVIMYPARVHAQQVTLSIDPPIVTTKIKPGKSFLVAYTVTNTGDPTPLQFLIRPFTPAGQLGAVTIGDTLEGPVQFQLQNTDITLEKPFFFNSNAHQQAVIRMTVPPETAEGDYYYMIVAETMPAESVEGKSVGLAQAQLGSPLLITVTNTGLTQVKAAVKEFSVKPDLTFTLGSTLVRILDSGKEIPATLVIQNNGQNVIEPQGSIVVRNGASQQTIPLLPQNILSHSERLVKTTPTDGIPAYSSVLLHHLPIGRVSIGAEVTFGDNTPVLFAQESFIAVPLQTIGVLFLLIMAVGAILMWKQKQTANEEE